MLYDFIARVAAWEPYSLHDIGHVPWVAQFLSTAGKYLDDLDHDLSDLSH